MIEWKSRSPEERGLLNPNFCATMLWHAAMGHKTEVNLPLPFELSFVVLPIVLHRGTRESLPRSTVTSLAVWLEQDPLVRSRIADRAGTLVKHTKEALTFGGLYDLLRLNGGTVEANVDWKRKVSKSLTESSDEVRICAKKSEFVGKWLAKAGDASTVMALIGVRP